MGCGWELGLCEMERVWQVFFFQIVQYKNQDDKVGADSVSAIDKNSSRIDIFLHDVIYLHVDIFLVLRVFAVVQFDIL